MGIVFETATPFDTPLQMRELIDWFNLVKKEGSVHPLIAVSAFVVVFLAIHPFQDGNGRLSRVLTTLLLMQAGYAYVPYSSLESIIEQSKQGYYLALRQTQTTLKSDAADWHPWMLFFLRVLSSQVRKLEGKLDREKILIAALPALTLQLLELTKERGRITVADGVTLTGANRNTVKAHLKQLVSDGHFAMHGAGRGVWYALK